GDGDESSQRGVRALGVDLADWLPAVASCSGRWPGRHPWPAQPSFQTEDAPPQLMRSPAHFHPQAAGEVTDMSSIHVAVLITRIVELVAVPATEVPAARGQVEFAHATVAGLSVD